LKIKWLGHAGFRIDDLIVDPWTKEMPGFGLKNNYEFSAADKQGVNVVCSSHSHEDHFLGGFELAKEANAVFVAGMELATEAMKAGCKAEFMNVGGTIETNGWKISMVPAVHSASTNPGGFVFQKGGKTIYHAGDTGLTKEMEFIGKQFAIDVALLPIGGRFTMDADAAVKAVKLLKPKVVVPMHYNTFPMIAADAGFFKKRIEKETKTNAVLLSLGEETEI